MRSALIKTLRGITSKLEYSLTSEEFSRRKGLFQGLDARVKLVTMLVLVIAVSLIHTPVVLLAYYILVLGLAIASAIPAGYFMTRVWLPLPLLTALVAVPALFITKGQPFIYLPAGLVITNTGATALATLFLRVGASVSLTILVVLTTPWAGILRALTTLRIPQPVVLLLGMTYRYIYVLLNLANDMLLARSSRMVGCSRPQEERAAEGVILGTMLSRSLEMSTEVYLAMRSRGFSGYGFTLQTGQLSRRDLYWTIFVALLLCLSIYVTVRGL